MKKHLIAALKQITAENYSSYNSWRMLTDQEIAQEYEWEYSKVKPVYGDIFPTVEDFKKAVKAGKAVNISEAQDQRIAYRSESESIDEVKEMVESYQFPRDVDRIVDGFKTNAKIPYPIVLEDDGWLRIMSGNTRMDVAYIMGITPKVLKVKVPEEEFHEAEKPFPEGVSNKTLKWLWGWLEGTDRKDPHPNVIRNIAKNFPLPKTTVKAYRGLHLKPDEVDSYASKTHLSSDRYSSWTKDIEEAKAFAFEEGDEEHTEGLVFVTTLKPDDILFDVEESLGTHWDISLEKELIVKPGKYAVKILASSRKDVPTIDMSQYY